MKRFDEVNDVSNEGVCGAESNSDKASEADPELAAAQKEAAERVQADRIIEASHDSEFEALFRIIKKNFEKISAANVIHHWVATFLQRITRQLILHVLDTTELTKNVVCVLVGGIQVETPAGIPNMFSLLTFDKRSAKGQMRSHIDQVHYHLRKQEQHSNPLRRRK